MPSRLLRTQQAARHRWGKLTSIIKMNHLTRGETMSKVAQFYRELVASLTERLRNGDRDIELF